MDWDLSDVVLSLGYDHENFISELAAYDYLTRASEMFSPTATFHLGPRLDSGLESKDSWNDYSTGQLASHWMARVGPFVTWGPGDYVRLRVGGGYDGVFVPITDGLSTYSTPFYAYGTMTHTVNDWPSYSASVAHENQLGWDTANAERTYLGLYPSFKFISQVESCPASTSAGAENPARTRTATPGTRATAISSPPSASSITSANAGPPTSPIIT